MGNIRSRACESSHCYVQKFLRRFNMMNCNIHNKNTAELMQLFLPQQQMYSMINWLISLKGRSHLYYFITTVQWSYTYSVEHIFIVNVQWYDLICSYFLSMWSEIISNWNQVRHHKPRHIDGRASKKAVSELQLTCDTRL